jgi:hypothetical protein
VGELGVSTNGRRAQEKECGDPKTKRANSDREDHLTALRAPQAEGDSEQIAQGQMEVIKAVRVQMKAVAEEAKSKDLNIKQLEAECVSPLSGGLQG